MKRTSFFLLCIFLTVVAVWVLCFSAGKINRTESSLGQTKYLELWHIDTFEGGTGSRRAFLEKIAALYQKRKNVCVTVKNQTVMSAEQNFSLGIYPDMISFGNGVELPCDMLADLEQVDVKTDIGNRCYAAVWCMGGYVKIYRDGVKINGLILSEQPYTISTLACALSDESLPVKIAEQSDKAIYSFYKNQDLALIGTQRDLYRLQNKGIAYKTQILQGYNDLYQYISVIAKDASLVEESRLFIRFLLSDECLSKLPSIGMLAPNATSNEQPLCALNGLSCMYATSAFIKREQIQNLKKQANDFYSNRESIINALKQLK